MAGDETTVSFFQLRTSLLQGSKRFGQRGWNGHPEGILIGLGTSPRSLIRNAWRERVTIFYLPAP